MLVLVSALVLVNAATFFVVSDNAAAGRYPIDADSIGIPIMSTLVLSVIALPILLLVGLLPSAQFLVRLCSRGLPWRISTGVLLLALYVILALFALDGVGYWAVPNHYWITASYVVSLLVLLFFSIVDARWLFSNSAPYRD